MSLEQSTQNLADAMNRYAAVIEKISNSDPNNVIYVRVVEAGAAAPAADAEKPKSKPGPKPKVKEEPAGDGLDGDDGLGGEEEAAKTYTNDEVKAALVALKKKDEGALKKVWSKFGVTSLNQIPAEKYGDVMKFVGSL